VDDPRARVARLPAPEGLAVVFEDEVLIAVNKPSGLLSQPGRQVEDSVVVRVRAARPDASGSLLVHRLDMDTSGVLLLAKTPEAHAALQQQFEKRQVQKRYRALIDGDVSGAGGLINLPLRLDVDRRPYQIVCPDHGRAAVTAWKLVDRLYGLEGDRLCLHAEKLVINHPQHGGRVKLESPSPFAL